MEKNSEICRLCLLSTNKQHVNLYKENVTTDVSLVDLINNYFKIEISENDIFSKLVCKPCISKLNDFHNFAVCVKRNNEFLTGCYEKTEDSGGREEDTTKYGLSDLTKKEDIEINYDDNDIKKETSSEENVLERNHSPAPDENNDDSDFSDHAESESKDTEKGTGNGRQIALAQLILLDLNVNKEKCCKETQKRKDSETFTKHQETPNDIQIKKFYKYECDLCSDHPEFPTFRSFNSHYKSKHSTSAQLKCCGKKFRKPYALVEHIEEHLMPDSLVCPTCNKRLRTKQTLQLHMDKHVPMDQRPLKCKYCEMRFMRNNFLVQHERVHLTDEELKYICDLCGKRFPTDWRLNTHLKSTHSDEKPFVCEVCARSFKLKVQLKNHMYAHNSKDKVYKQCEHCGIWLRSPRSYYCHIKDKHDETAPKSFPCDKCAHVSPSKKALYSHSTNKHGPKKHKCVYCAEAFSSSNLLRSHMIKHTGPGEPLKCPFCPKSFSFRSGYYSHKKKAHSNMTEQTELNNK